MEFKQLRDYLHRNSHGYWYVWTSEDKFSTWAPVGKDIPIPNHHSNVYFNVNPSKVQRESNQRTRNMDIACINATYAEFDVKDYGSFEKARQQIRSLAIRPTVVVCSGGGYHCYYFLKETFFISSGEDLERAQHLQAGWVEYTHSDKGAKDLARVLRVIGSRNYKPVYAPHFPPVEIVFSDTRRVYGVEQLEAVLPKPKPKPQVQPMHFGKGYVEKALQNETDRVLSAGNGSRNTTLNNAAYALGKLVAQGAISRSRVEGILLAAALGSGLPMREAERTIESGLNAHSS